MSTVQKKKINKGKNKIREKNYSMLLIKKAFRKWKRRSAEDARSIFGSRAIHHLRLSTTAASDIRGRRVFLFDSNEIKEVLPMIRMIFWLFIGYHIFLLINYFF